MAPAKVYLFPKEKCGATRDGAPSAALPSAFVPYGRQIINADGPMPRHPPVSVMKSFHPSELGKSPSSSVESSAQKLKPQKKSNVKEEMADQVKVDPNLVITPSGMFTVMAPKTPQIKPGQTSVPGQQFYNPSKRAVRSKNTFGLSRLCPIKESIVDYLKIGDSATFLTTAPYRLGRAAGIVSRSEDDLDALSFNAVVKKMATWQQPLLSPFQPPVSTVVAAFSPSFNEWFRACIIKKSTSSAAHSVLYIDYGNTEDGITDIKPIPTGYLHPGLAVKLTLKGINEDKIEDDLEDFVARRLSAESRFDLQILKEGKDGSVLAMLYDEV